MLKRFAPSQKKKRKNSETIFTPTPNQEGCLTDEDYIFPSDSENSEEDTESLSEEDSIEDYIAHLEDIRALSEEDFALLKEDIRSQGMDFQM